MKHGLLRHLLSGFLVVASLGSHSLLWADATSPGAVPPGSAPAAPLISVPLTPLTFEGLYYDNLSTTAPISHLAMKLGNLGGRSPTAVTCEYYTAMHLVGPVVEPVWTHGQITQTSNSSYICEPVYSTPAYAINLAGLDTFGMRVYPAASEVSSDATVTRSGVSSMPDTDFPVVSDFSISGDYYVAPDGTKYFGSSINLSMNASDGDSGSGIRNCSYQLSDFSGVVAPVVEILPRRTSVAGVSETAVCLAQVGVDTRNNLRVVMAAKDNVWNSTNSEIISAQGDHTKPSSQIGALASTQTSVSFSIPYTASDGSLPTVVSGVKSVDLYSRHRDTTPGSPWIYAILGPYAYTGAPIPIIVTQNGEYQYYTSARDNVNNVEDTLLWDASVPPSTRIVSTTVNAAMAGVGASLTLTPASLSNFPNTNIGQTSAPVTIQISNASVTTPLNLGALNLLGTNASQFNLSSSCSGTTIAVGTASCAVTITFRPTVVGVMNAQLQINSNTPSPLLVNLSGTGVSTAPDFDMAIASPTLSVSRGASSTATVNITRRNGFTGAVVVTLTSSNPGITADALTIPAAASSGTLTVRATSAVDTTNYSLTVVGDISVVGTAGHVYHNAPLNLTVNADGALPPPSGAGGGCSLGAASSSFGLLSWMLGLFSILVLRIRIRK